MPYTKKIREEIEATLFIDTHEHLIEETCRLEGECKAAPRLMPCNDWSYLFMHYLGDDLASAGMSDPDLARFLSPELSLPEKYALLAPYWEKTKHTGYAQAVRRTLSGLYGETEVTLESVYRLEEKYHALIRPGYYRHVLREKSGVEVCQVNSLEALFMETAQPDILQQDIGFPPLSTDLDLSRIQKDTGKIAENLDDWLAYIDWIFAKYGGVAVAAKNQSAYSRRLNYTPATRQQAEPIFAKLAAGASLPFAERKPLHDYLFRYCITKATECDLPVKLHTGYYAGHNRMPLERLRQNAGDLSPLLQEFPDTRFILMHIGYPYQDEFIALAKHYRNAYIDLCWAWIINPAACVRFVKEFLTAAPANKLLTFGGDYITVENIYGHSQIARQGLAQALSELVAEGWIRESETSDLIQKLMRDNALALLPKR